MKILVIGCTGTVGSNVMRKLLSTNEDVRCMTHKIENLNILPTEVEAYVGDLDNPATLPESFDGVEELFLLLPVGPRETEQGLAAVEEAKNADLRKIVYMSVYMPPDSTHIPHFRSKIPIEEAVRNSGIPYTILRPNNFFQNDLSSKDAIVRYHLYPQPIGPVGLNRVDVRDIADAAVNALLQAGHDDMTYNLHGPDALTGEKTAQLYSRYLEQQVNYIGDNLDTWEERMRGIIPEGMARDFRIIYEYFQTHGFLASPADFALQQKILQHDPRSFESFVKEVTAAWKSEMLVRT